MVLYFLQFVIVITVLLYSIFDLGHYGSTNDSGVLAKSKIGEMNEARVRYFCPFHIYDV